MRSSGSANHEDDDRQNAPGPSGRRACRHDTRPGDRSAASSPSIPPDRRSEDRTLLLALLVLAALLRLALVAHGAATHPELYAPERAALEAAVADPEQPVLSRLGFEVSNVAAAWVCRGRGLADPFGVPTGPTGWVSPGTAGLWALAFSLFGCWSPGAVLFLAAVALALSLAQVLLSHRAARELFGPAPPGTAPWRRAPLLAAGLAAVSPWDLRIFAAGSALDWNLYATLSLALFVLLVRFHRRPGRGRLVAFCAATAAATLFLPGFVLAAAVCLPVSFLLRRWRPESAGKEATTPAPSPAPAPAPTQWRHLAGELGTLALAVALLVGPWTLHQHHRIGAWTLVKSNAPFEVWIGNLPDVDGLVRGNAFERHHPSGNPEELAAYRELGEVDYVWRRFFDFLERERPGPFLARTARRAAHFFFLDELGPGEAPWSRWPKALMGLVPGLVLIAYPLLRLARGRLRGRDLLAIAWCLALAGPYLVTWVMDRYELPVVVVVLVLVAGMLEAPTKRLTSETTA